MTVKEAIKILEVAKAECEWNAPLEYQVAFDMAISALKKQVPKKPQVMEFYVTLAGNIRKMHMCGECGAFVSDQSSYCWNCGQAINWGGE